MTNETETSDPSREDEYRQLLDTAPDAIVVVGEDSRIEIVNVQAERLFGFTRAELVGHELEILIPPRFRGAHAGHTRRFFSAPTVRSMGSGLELFGIRKDGKEIPIEVSLSPVHRKGKPSVSAAIRDISERRAIQVALEEARRAAEAGSAAKSEFLSSMSHELRTPLNAILGFAQLLQRDKKEPLSARHKERVQQILRGGEHLLRLIDDILDLSRIEAGRVAISTEPIDAIDVLEEVIQTLQPTAARAGIATAISDVPASLPAILADRTRLTQILMNFGSNAIKYNSPGGMVTFVVSRAETSALRITVIDTGMGVPEDQQDKLFQPFQRAGQETGPIEGTGIGLAITKRLVGLMGGTVGFTSSPGKGSEFWVELPAETEAAGLAREKQQREKIDAGPRSRQRGVILYVEDNPANVSFMRDLLGAFEGIDLLVAPTAEMGIELATARAPRAIIMDINLPGISGLEALKRLSEIPATRGIPVVALTAAASERDKQRGEQAGFYRYLTKPVKVDELEAALEEILGP